MALKPRAIEMHIEELVLRGFAAADRLSIADAMQGELSRLIADHGVHGVSAGTIAIERLDSGAFAVAPGAGAKAIGTQIAGAIHKQFASGVPKNARHSRGGA
jgi:hypothetical protein